MHLSNWNKPPPIILLQEYEIHLWLVNLSLENSSIESIKENLILSEIERADKFHFKKDRNSFIVARGSLRVILSKYLNSQAQNIIFKYNKYGKPFLEFPSVNNVNFNLSHSKDFALIGITSKGKIGVDIEYIKNEFVTNQIVKNYFSKNEIIELFNLPKEKQHKGFFNCWTRKEAYIKAEGKGLSIPLDSFDVTLDEDSPRIVRIENENNLLNWKLYNQNVDDNYCAAIANYGNIKNIVNYYVEDISKLQS